MCGAVHGPDATFRYGNFIEFVVQKFMEVHCIY